MKFLLAAINAKYIHSNPAVYSLKMFAKEQRPKADIEIGEYTINHQMDHVLEDIFRRKPDFVGFSCYIWNISQVLEITRDLHKILPKCEIWLGGPEVSYNAEEILMKEPQIRGIMRGEGELTFTELVSAYMSADYTRINQIQGITCRGFSGTFYNNGPQRLLSMDEIPFYYADMTEFENRIVYYESSRGCPFSCSYCLSSIDKSVRFRSLDLVKKELDFFLEHKVPQVKFIDRTFNCKREHTLGIWKHILEHDNGVTNFHFEVSADLFDEEELALIAKMRPGLIQLEIGVQSTNLDTITEIHRRMNLERLKKRVERIHSYRNTHQHLDLIAGLPYENMSSFLMSFDDVYDMRPDQLQLGFLKVLKGSYMAAHVQEYELKYRSVPPYEVLSTKWLSYQDVIRLKEMEEMVEVHYNSGQFSYTLRLLEKEFSHPSSMFLALADYYEKNGLFGFSHNRLARYEILYNFLKEKFAEEELPKFRDALMYDLYLRENLKSRPSFAGDQSDVKYEVREFFAAEAEKPEWLLGYEGYDSRQLIKMAHMEHMEDGSFILFDYKNRDPLNKNAKAVRFIYEERGTNGEKGIEESQKRESDKDPRESGRGVWHRVPLLSES
ncbi:MAG: B12-binding domain-containing radical SAM protein [Lachnospiraceae bacterium]|nr:B12-binding domain-containing radical SAM protein [Lachnospiraceae bacterium]MBQ5698682.1 B12-binding domain-containing radical SAM protein [Lachnospiraceae bacterium]